MRLHFHQVMLEHYQSLQPVDSQGQRIRLNGIAYHQSKVIELQN
jgi:hypothetical protein